MNQGNYLELLCDHLPGSFEMCQASTFMQDCAPCHTAKKFVGDNKTGVTQPWLFNYPNSKLRCTIFGTHSLPSSHGAGRQPSGPFGRMQETSREAN
ncbi:hypothetical protein E2C01_017745 [Portunus trituberculatus]|uniref:Uncharacterized protein n=1 Tax=Portunus trituberculatus TaxID=210409 RepID=A0A5B7DUC8_PORTR|nr:hypothetical protein [Portunus trituberculatus]